MKTPLQTAIERLKEKRNQYRSPSFQIDTYDEAIQLLESLLEEERETLREIYDHAACLDPYIDETDFDEYFTQTLNDEPK